MLRPRHLILTTLAFATSCGPEAPASGPLPGSSGPDSKADTGLVADTGVRPLPPGVDEAWIRRVGQRIERGTLGFEQRGADRYGAERGEAGFELSALGLTATTASVEQELRLRFSAWGREGATERVQPVTPRWGDCLDQAPVRSDDGCQRALELAHPGLTEIWRPTPTGVEQAWRLPHPPVGDGLVMLELDLGQVMLQHLDDDALGVQLIDASGGAWRYAGLRAWDAQGEPLAALLETTPAGLRIVLDDAGAVYPIMVDPTLTEDSKLTASDGDYADTFGYSVSSAGDVDGDGYDDVIVGAYQDTTGGYRSGSAYVFHGSSGGIDTASETKLYASDGDTSDAFGSDVSTAGDVNADGYDDVLIGAYQDDDAGSSSGATYLYLGSSTGVSIGSEVKITASDAAAGDAFGYGLSGLGDVDGDGYDDVVIGAYSHDGAASQAGAAYLFYGSAAGIDTSRETLIQASDAAADVNFGLVVSGAGDVNGDGYADLFVGAPRDDGNGNNAGAVYVFHGATTGIDTSSETKLYASDGNLSDQFGLAIGGAGDVDGDGYDDLIAGAPYDDDLGSASGSAYLFLGSASGIDSASETKLNASDGAASDDYGYTVAGAGDLDGDGYHDVLIGAYQDDDGAASAGSAYVYFGSSTGVDSSSETKLTASDAAASDFFGRALSSAGDLDGDGMDDLIVGASGDDDGGANSGSAYIFLGACTAGTWYADSDGDGYGDSSSATVACGAPSGTVGDSSDCDDSDDAIHPGATETCDGADNDCDGTVDEDDASDASTWYADSDGDGYGDPSLSSAACTQPSGSVSDDNDCDDGDSATHPGATETCDSSDNDCDGLVDEDAVDMTPWYADADGDGYGDPDASTMACTQPSGTVGDDSDCDDGDSAINPAATETCDGADNDCDGSVDEDDASDTSTWYADSDGDGYGDPSVSSTFCAQPSGTVGDSSDCDDGDGAINPAATELCDGADNDCDGSVDEDDASDASNWYADSDGDGYGDPSASSTACAQPSGTVGDSSDCDDGDSAVHPGATETCDSVDNDCDGGVDEDATGTATWYSDDDGDGYGDPDASTEACAQPSGTVANDSDCDDGDSAIHPAATELCDGVDNDCDDSVDEDDASDASTWYADNDGDGYGDPSVSSTACAQPSGTVGDDRPGLEDCDDGDGAIHPAATELCDGIDNDCDGTVDEGASDAQTWYADADGDGYGDPGASSTACAQPTGSVSDDSDCDDGDGAIHPAATELCDGVDNDCDDSVDEDDASDAGTWYADTDGDGYTVPEGSTTACEAPSGYGAASELDDCDDTDASVHPGADEVADDGIDQDCDGDDDITAPDDTGEAPDDTGEAKDPEGCSGCAAGEAPRAPWLLLGLAAVTLGRRRRTTRSTQARSPAST